MGHRAIDEELAEWVKHLRNMEPASKRVGDLRELDDLLDKLDRLDGPGAGGRWHAEHLDDIQRVLIPLRKDHTPDVIDGTT